MIIVKLLILSLMLTITIGCSGNLTVINANKASIRTDVFDKVVNEKINKQGFTDLRIRASMKTHKPGVYSISDIHGTPDYRLLLNIDGQAVLLGGVLSSENSDQMKLADPEAGDGIRYRFSEHLLLKAGTHRVVVALPNDGIVVEREVVLTDGDVNNLVIEPVYGSVPRKRLPGTYSSTTSFKEGIRTVMLVLNGRNL